MNRNDHSPEHLMGSTAFHSGQGLQSNPYHIDDCRSDAWEEGWLQAQAEQLDSLRGHLLPFEDDGEPS